MSSLDQLPDGDITHIYSMNPVERSLIRHLWVSLKDFSWFQTQQLMEANTRSEFTK